MEKRLKNKYISFIFWNLLPLLILFFLYLFKEYRETSFRKFITEDGPLEYLQFFLYFLSFLGSLFISLQYFKNKTKETYVYVLFFILSLLFFFIAFEEISWGQRILVYDTPQSITERNAQGELPIHNLEPLQLKMHYLYILIGFYGSFCPILCKTFLKKYYDELKIFFPPKEIFMLFFLAIPFWILASYYPAPISFLSGTEVIYYQWQEVFETFLAIGFFTYICNVIRIIKD